MKNKLTKILYFLAGSLVTLIALRIIVSRSNHMDYKMFIKDSKVINTRPFLNDNLHLYIEEIPYLLLGLPPQTRSYNLDCRFNISIMEELNQYEEYELLKMKEVSISFPYSNWLGLRSKNFNRNQGIEFIRLPFWYNLDDYSQKAPYAYYSIDLKKFNKYLRLKGIKKREKLIKTYLYFFSTLEDSSHYKIISSKSDLITLLDSYPVMDETLEALNFFGDTVLTVENIKLEKEGLVYCWFYDQGFFSFGFYIDEKNRLYGVDLEYIGHLGNEFERLDNDYIYDSYY